MIVSTSLIRVSYLEITGSSPRLSIFPPLAGGSSGPVSLFLALASCSSKPVLMLSPLVCGSVQQLSMYFSLVSGSSRRFNMLSPVAGVLSALDNALFFMPSVFFLLYNVSSRQLRVFF